MGFALPNLPEYKEDYEMPPREIWDISSEELAERYSYTKAMLACAQRVLAERQSVLVIQRAKRNHIREKTMFLYGGKESKQWQVKATLADNEEYIDLDFDVMQAEAFVVLQTGIVKQYTDVAEALSREQTRRGDLLRSGNY